MRRKFPNGALVTWHDFGIQRFGTVLDFAWLPAGKVYVVLDNFENIKYAVKTADLQEIKPTDSAQLATRRD